ncbi:hypothetical protein AeMF1_013965 [Aphanomyces euteiches]|nr:hypothetical protein AeMF1_013965 [Aphanomyces euteiches]KAH9185016.1 hypothetical protein AeNC1_013012 [Aphanomyces euteiches]
MMAINPGFRPQVSLAQAEQIRTVCKRSMQELLSMAAACDTSDRKLHYTYMPPRTSSEAAMTLCVSTTLYASLQDIQDIMQSRISRTNEAREFAKAVETHVKGSRLLMKISDNIALNWAVIESMSSVMRDRDFVYVQAREYREDLPHGRPTWISCTHSIKVDGVPPLDTSVYDVIRGGIYSSGYVFTEMPDSLGVHAVFCLQVDFKGQSPHVICQSTLKNWANALGRMRLFFERRQLGLLSDLILSDIQVKNYRTGMQCHVCAEPFGMLGKPDNCRICGEVVCSRCVEKKEVPLKNGPTKLSMCVDCLNSSMQPESFSPTLRRVGSGVVDTPQNRDRLQEASETILLPSNIYRKRASTVSRSRRIFSTSLPPPRITKDIPDDLDVLNKVF